MAAHHQSARVWWSRASRQRSLNRAGMVTRPADHTERPSRTRVTIMDVAVIIGTSGWQYRDWRGRFYPAKLPQRLWLEHYAEFFATVESNNAFYRLPEHATFVAWRERTPPDFRWAGKAPRVPPAHKAAAGAGGPGGPPAGPGRGAGAPAGHDPAAAPADSAGRRRAPPRVPGAVPIRHPGGRRTPARQLVDR